MRKRPGIGAIQKQKVEQEKFKGKAVELQEATFEQITRQMEVFRGHLEEFASKHRDEIKKDANFRRQFQEMCASIGVDPLASSKGFWSEVLGVGDFYYELGIQAIEVCLATSYRNGGVITLGELRERLIKARGKAAHHQNISNDDILRAIKKLKALNSGFTIIPLQNGQDSQDILIRSIPGELSEDHAVVLKLAEKQGFISIRILKSELNWSDARSLQILGELLRDGLAWVDDQGVEKTYWFPSFFTPLTKGAD